ncbi:MAG: lipopolysaccharide biosynthesis protein [Candidatus Pedobacter colombiensis]|uniref:Lipopolysaccharide biosynthesis protein n=1 Tax=Candidatus Pedobacter colombiensis TaxID=3121371 RepID=A0AAJ6BAE9_9SPHI|nr:lipopolysaccharide biosynthesis protein [Pedobacter sp.]WEK21198.1 MAG: lipopolysaccharide biosynthesis protein [Pedobacter sp.]
MDIKKFLKLLFKYKWLVILVPVIAVTITYFLVRNLPNEYNAQVKLSTGLLDQSKQVITEQNTDFFKISQQFSNIMEKLKMKKMLNILSYNLIIHDLSDPAKSFRKYSKKVDSLNHADRLEVIKLFQEKLASKSLLTLADKSGKYRLFDIVNSMGYGEYVLGENIEVKHVDNSDFIDISYTSENPYLSAFLVNTLATEFIKNFSSEVGFNQHNSIEMLNADLKKKEDTMNAKNAALKDFKMRNGVLNIDKQSELVYQQITQAEDRKAQVIRDIQSTRNTIGAINNKLSSRDPDMGGNVVRDNGEIVKINSQIELANRRYVDGGFKLSDKKKVDSLVAVKDALTTSNSDRYIVDPQVSRQNLLQQKYTLETTLAQLTGSVNSIDKELAEAKSKYYAMVPFDAGIQNYMRDADLATKEYTEALTRYNQNKTDQNIGLKLNIEEYGLPGFPLPSKKILYLIISAFGSLLLCLMVIAGMSLLDQSINSASQLAAMTKLNVVGNLSFIASSDRSIRNIWKDKGNPDYAAYKNLLRSLRFEISNKMNEDASKILGITSLSDGEGKTMVAYNLAYSFAMIGKKVLLIGEEPITGDKSNSKALTMSQNFESFLVKREVVAEDLITILNKNNESASLLEIQNEKSLYTGFKVLKDEFDLVIIDVNSLRDINIAKEWLSFTEKNIAVFESGKSLTDSKMDFINILRKQPGFIGWVLNKIKLSEYKNGDIV